jgi:hypothetical protein
LIALTKKAALVLLALSGMSLAAGQGGEFWSRKKYQEWSEKECRKLLEDSPWSQKHTLSQTLIEPLQRPPLDRGPATNSSSPDVRIPDPNRADGSGRAREARPEIVYQVQLRSAPPIRQAMVRLEQIGAKYDQMQPDQQRAFDQKAGEFLGKAFPDTISLHVSYRSNVQVDDRELAAHWQRQTTDMLRNFVFLIASGGDKVSLLDYRVAQGGGREFQLTFPRKHGDEPLVGSRDKTLQLEFPHPVIRGQKGSRVLISFKVEKMLIDGAAVY